MILRDYQETGTFFQNSVQNTRPTLQLIICRLQIYNFIYGMTGWIDKLGLYSCTPGLWKSVLPSCQSSSHSASAMTRSACGASITAYVFQQLGREESTQTERRVRMWGQRKGWEHKMYSDKLCREPMGVVGHRTSLHRREVNAGELLSWINWSNKPRESNSQQKWLLFLLVW